ncbi:MAG: cupin domain-containing protein [Chloroflexi bacterium]|nr:cupin domain-containing protein [Chloroflexota bacterium]
MEPRIIGPDEGRRVSLFEVAFRYRMESSQTDGALAMLEVVIPPGTLVKPHRHSRENEYTLVLEGTVGVRMGDRETEVGAGSCLVKPRDVPHAMWNASDIAARVAEDRPSRRPRRLLPGTRPYPGAQGRRGGR